MSLAPAGSGGYHPEQQRLLVRVGVEKAFCSPTTTFSCRPSTLFAAQRKWAATALHKLSHWTGHPSRLNREEAIKARFGFSAYAMEDLRAELAKAFIAGIPQHAT
jgi:antirestriction protein ArdC